MTDKPVSENRAAYLAGVRRRTRWVHACQVGFLALFLALWEGLTRADVLDAFIVSSPSRIVGTLLDMSQNNLALHIGVTLYETLTGFLLGVVIGLALSIALWWSGFASRVAEPYLVVLNSLPKIALGPVIIILVGAVLLTLPVAWADGFTFSLARLAEPVLLGNVLYLGVGASALCFLAWNKATALIGPVATSVYLYLQPVVTVAASLLVLAEPVTPLTLAAVALILCGLALSQYRGKKSKQRA